MRSAPAVTITLQVDPGWQSLVTLASIGSPLSALGWVLAHGFTDPFGFTPGRVSVILAGLAALAVAARFAWHVRTPESQQLRCDGEALTLTARQAHVHDDPATALNLTVAIDRGHWMLLRAASASPQRRWAPSHWLAVSQAQQPLHWHALRCALHSPGVSRHPPGGEPAHG